MIYVDDRKGSAELAPLIPKSTPRQITRLPYADFHFIGFGPNDTISTIGIERKTVMDLLSSMTTGRLSGHQLIGLLAEYDVVYLLVEGLWRPRQRDGILERWVGKGKWQPATLGQRRFMAKEVGNFLNTLAVACGVYIWRTDGPDHSARWLSDTYHWWQKPWDKHRSHMAAHTPSPPHAYLSKPTLAVRLAKEFKDVGWDKAEAIAKHFGSARAMLVAMLARDAKKKLKDVPGVGKVIAENVVKHLSDKG